ncbi:MAG TPA: hypothetical protein VKD90_17805 [Gemmataceae bacterium]|nr:hypothetical protein [Gemmataceae bacterium]
MRTRLLVALLLALAVAAPAAAQAPNTNAALKYWQAFGLMPTLDKDQEKIVEDWNKVPLDDAARKVIDQSRNSVQYLHRGAKLDRCDWAPDYEDGIGLLLPHLAKARTLARLAALHARAEFEQEHGKAGGEHVLAILRLGRHVQTDPIMVNHLVGYSIEQLAIDAAAPYLPSLKGQMPADAAAALDRLPASPPLSGIMAQERDSFLRWTITQLTAAEAKKPGSWQDFWKGLFAGDENPDNRRVAESAKTVEQAVQMVEGLIPLYGELEKLTALSWKEFDARYPEFVRKANADSPLAKAIMPAVDKVGAARRRAEARLAMFKAAIAVVQGGPDKVKETKDPFGDGPFEYRALDKGFELKSKLIFKDKPVTLTVGK